MKIPKLKSFDVASYDVEIEFSKKIAPIQKKIDRLDNNHETKSLKAHKDFLSREKSSKNKLVELDETRILKIQRIERAAENKLVKLRRKDQRIKEDFVEFKKAQNTANEIELAVIHEQISELSKEENVDKEQISKKYKQNVESYVEKLDTYNSNFENNKQTFINQYDKYATILDDNLRRIDKVKEESDQIIKNLFEQYVQQKNDEDLQSKKLTQESEKIINKDVIDIRKNSNVKQAMSKTYVDKLKHESESRYKKYIKELEIKQTELQEDFDKRKELIHTDLNVNTERLDEQINELDKKDKKQIKMINQKKALFAMRASAVIEYEEKIHNEKIKQIEDQINSYKNILQNELLNYDKLVVFLVNDQEQLKATGEYFKTLNLNLNDELLQSELVNNETLTKHEKLKTDFLNNYTVQFNEIKRRLIESNRAQIDQLGAIFSELDDINKFLDTVEPLKEIELNKLRESIELTEIQERYKIKYAKQDHEIKLLNNNNRKVISLEDTRNKDLLSENNQTITNIKNKETMDKAVEDAKLKYNKANEIYKLRLNSTKLERSILKSSYETELEKSDLSKDLVVLNTEKRNILLQKEIETQINNIKLETSYRKEVVKKRVEEDCLKLEEQITRISSDRDAFETSLDQMVSEEEQKTDTEIIKINNQMDQKLELIDEALTREIKEPTLNIARAEVIIKEKMSKFDINEHSFNDYIASTTSLVQDETLTTEQQKQVLIKNKQVFERVNRFIEGTYECLTDAIQFMNEIEKRAILNQISATPDNSKTKKLKKQLSKFEAESKKQLATIKQAKEEHKSRITTLIKGNFQRLQKQKNLEFDGLKEQVESIFKNIKNQLLILQSNIVKEVETLYQPLTKKDQEIVDKANKNAIKARELVERDREVAIQPINNRLGEYIKEKEDEKHRKIAEYNKQIQTLTSSINDINDSAAEKINDVEKDQQELIETQNRQLVTVRANEKESIDKQIADIAQFKIDLESSYIEKLAQLDEKDDEAGKIFEYEERIYNIALETAESRYNDAVIKTNKAHDITLHKNEEERTLINTQTERNIERINKELLDATNEFEKNIFTTRPKFEESIGDAQRAIDEEQKEKQQKKESLELLAQKNIEAIDSGLYTSFSDAYVKLEANLAFYLEKYKVIEEEYFNQISEENERIMKNFNVYKNALIELGKDKISKTQKELLNINDHIT